MKVEVDGRTFDFEKCAFSWMDGNGNAVATASNYPVQLSWATTVHKAQGMTLDQMSVDLQALWEPGHAYVAMSRVRSPEGLFIPAWSEKSFKVDPLVKKFYELGCPYDLQDQLTMLQEEEFVEQGYDDDF
jgi:ATP-dependent exoDNAse (exonuclease V) alpha subunit